MDKNYNSEIIKLNYQPIVVESARELPLKYDNSVSRLIIDRIEVKNFKSYGDMKIIGPFHPNFTCIIGQNGSGMSNVIDALSFAFGFRTSKIRSEKLSVLIHKSETSPNNVSCYVKVFFQRIKSMRDRSDEYDVILGSGFVVSRIAFNDNSSIYQINEGNANEKEMADFLQQQGIVLDHNRFMILQGEVEQIALMNPKAATEYEDGLLEYLEDIIGSHRFKKPIKRLEKLHKLNSSKLNRIQNIKQMKENLEGVRNEAVKYLRLHNEIVIQKNICFQSKLRDLRQDEASAIEEQNKGKEELDEINVKMTKINQLHSEKEKELKKTFENIRQKMKEFGVIQKQFYANQMKFAQLRIRQMHTELMEQKDLLKDEKGDIAEPQGAMSEGGDRQSKEKIGLVTFKIHKSGQAFGGLENNNQGLEKIIKNEQKLNDASQKSTRLEFDLPTATNNQNSYQDIVETMLIEDGEEFKEELETLKVYENTDKEVKELFESIEMHTQKRNELDELLQQTKQNQIQINRCFEYKKSKVDSLRRQIKQKQDEIKKLNLYPIPEGVNENDDDVSFMDLIGESDSQINIFSSQKDSHTGTKLKTYSDEELSVFEIDEIPYRYLEDKLIEHEPNLAAIGVYRNLERLYLQRAPELEKITQLRDFQNDQLQPMKEQRHQEFSARLNLINGNLKKIYKMITKGGDAKLELVDSRDPFSEGILFSVRPPKKSWTNISSLSGGEKSLAALALVFALQDFKPTPFYVMDEIDAALDFDNELNVAEYIQDHRSKDAQFIIISHQDNMHKLSDRLVGICKPFNVSNASVVLHNDVNDFLKSSHSDQSNARTNAATDAPNNLI